MVGSRRMEPYYTVMKLPGETEEEFIVMLPFVPKTKENLSAWMVARNDGDLYGGMRVYEFPKDRVLYGPNQVFSRFNQDSAISEKLTLWSQRGSSTNLGTMLVIPVEESLIYIQPLYLQATRTTGRGDESGSAIPELKRVLVGYEDRIAMEPTLEEALRRLILDEGPTVEAPDPAPVEPGQVVPEPAVDVVADEGAAQRAMLHYQTAEAAAEGGDWAGYGEALDALEAALQDLVDESNAAASREE